MCHRVRCSAYFCMEKFKQRIITFARERYDMGQTRFEDYCGIHHGTISAIKSSGPSASVVTRISVACPDLNLNWLFRGEGPMLNGAQSETAQSTPSVSIGTIQTVNIGNWNELVELLKTNKQ